MNKASPVQMRKSLEFVNVLKDAGIRFVPIPVFDDIEFNARVAEANEILEELDKRISAEEDTTANV